VDDDILEVSMPYIADSKEGYDNHTALEQNQLEQFDLLVLQGKGALGVTTRTGSNRCQCNMSPWRWTVLLTCQQKG